MSILSRGHFHYMITIGDDLIKIQDKDGNFIERQMFPCEYAWTTLAKLMQELNSDIEFVREQ